MSKKLVIFSWSMYDFANTIFAMNVITLYFALWVTVDMKGEDILYSWALSGSMLLAAITAPIMGAISDKLGRRMPFLIFFTLACCIFTACISIVNQLFAGLLFFAVANFCYQLADIFYNSLLAQVSDNKETGRISGYGTSLGYVGAIVGLLLVSPFVLKFGRQAAFIPTAFFFFLFALPCFLFVKDAKAKQSPLNQNFLSIIKEAFIKLRNTFINIRAYKNLMYFLIAAFISLNAINTIFIFMSVYIKKVIAFSDSKIIVFYVVSSVFAIIGSLVAGFITDAIGAKRTLTGVLIMWCVAALLAIFTFNETFFWFIGPLVGISLGGTWTSARTLAVHLSPPHMVGEVFGFYGLVGKTASVVGPLIWGISIWSFGFLGTIKYRIGIFILLLFLCLGLIILQKVSEDKT